MLSRVFIHAATLALCSVVLSNAASSNTSAAIVSTNIAALRAQAEQGVAKAQSILGLCYLYGTRVTEEKAEAARWFRKAAEQGFPAAQFYLGKCYYSGDGVVKDKKASAVWFRKAAEQGFFAAQYNLALCYAQGEGVTADQAEAAKWFRKAAEQRYPAAQYNLGVFYYNGAGVNKDLVEAYKWLLIAKAAGVAEAEALCKIAASKMSATQVAAAEAMVVTWQQEHAAAHPATQ